LAGPLGNAKRYQHPAKAGADEHLGRRVIEGEQGLQILSVTGERHSANSGALSRGQNSKVVLKDITVSVHYGKRYRECSKYSYGARKELILAAI
jgi:hypothetical protein